MHDTKNTDMHDTKNMHDAPNKQNTDMHDTKIEFSWSHRKRRMRF